MFGCARKESASVVRAALELQLVQKARLPRLSLEPPAKMRDPGTDSVLTRKMDRFGAPATDSAQQDEGLCRFGRHEPFQLREEADVFRQIPATGCRRPLEADDPDGTCLEPPRLFAWKADVDDDDLAWFDMQQLLGGEFERQWVRE